MPSRRQCTTTALWRPTQAPPLAGIHHEMDIRKACKMMWETKWHDVALTYRLRFGRNINHDMADTYAGLTKAQASVLIQMRTEIALNRYLYCMNRTDTPDCDCGKVYHTVAHILEACPIRRSRRRQFLAYNCAKLAQFVLSAYKSACHDGAFESP